MSDETALKLGELRAFVERHGLTDDAVVRLDQWDDQHDESFEVDVTSAVVRIGINGRQELILHVER